MRFKENERKKRKWTWDWSDSTKSNPVAYYSNELVPGNCERTGSIPETGSGRVCYRKRHTWPMKCQPRRRGKSLLPANPGLIPGGFMSGKTTKVCGYESYLENCISSSFKMWTNYLWKNDFLGIQTLWFYNCNKMFSSTSQSFQILLETSYEQTDKQIFGLSPHLWFFSKINNIQYFVATFEVTLGTNHALELSNTLNMY